MYTCPLLPSDVPGEKGHKHNELSKTEFRTVDRCFLFSHARMPCFWYSVGGSYFHGEPAAAENQKCGRSQEMWTRSSRAASSGQVRNAIYSPLVPPLPSPFHCIVCPSTPLHRGINATSSLTLKWIDYKNNKGVRYKLEHIIVSSQNDLENDPKKIRAAIVLKWWINNSATIQNQRELLTQWRRVQR